MRSNCNHKILIPKKFKKKVEYVKNGILLDEHEINEQLRNNSLEVDSNYVSYWMDIRVDDMIDNRTKCDYIQVLDRKANIFDSNVGCENYTQNPGNNLYPESDFDPEDCE